MKIVNIFPPHLYSIQYDCYKTDEYHRLFALWMDADYVGNYFDEAYPRMDKSFWKSHVKDAEDAADRCLNEAYDLYDYVIQLRQNTVNGKWPDFDEWFKHALGGEFAGVYTQEPMKAYGEYYPSLLRFYAIRIDTNCYIITGGGIKYVHDMHDQTDLEIELSKVRDVRSFLIKEGIEEPDEINNND